MAAISSALRAAGKLRLAHCIDQNWHKTCLSYSKELNFWRPKRAMEPALFRAFGKELERLGFTDLFKKEILSSLQRRRVLQTTPHLGATEGPRFFCINWLGSLGTPEKDFYVVGMYSGIPFSNHTRPGRINRKSHSLNLFPSTLQDALVYRSVVPKKLVEAMAELPKNVSQYFPYAVEGGSYTKWALEACQHIERQALGKKNMVYLDINEVVSEYLVQVLRDRRHIVHKIFFDPQTRDEFMGAFPDEIIFYAPVQHGKYEEMENFFLHGNVLNSRSRKITLDDPEVVIKELSEGRLCPALLLGFLVLAFLNQFKCFGSFAQVEYLPVYQEKLGRLSFMEEFKIGTIPTSNLTTGVFVDGRTMYPLDVLVDGKKFKPDPNAEFGVLLMRMKDALLSSYFTGSTRNRHEQKK
jgi:hypothetical protein